MAPGDYPAVGEAPMKLAVFGVLLASFGFACGVPPGVQPPLSGSEGAEFRDRRRVEIVGYTGSAMEPFISCDARHLFFNNRNEPATLTDVLVAERLAEDTYRGPGVRARHVLRRPRTLLHPLRGIGPGDPESDARIGNGALRFAAARGGPSGVRRGSVDLVRRRFALLPQKGRGRVRDLSGGPWPVGRPNPVKPS